MNNTLATIRGLLRTRLGDEVAPYRWSDVALNGFINFGGFAIYPAIYKRVTDKSLVTSGTDTLTVPATIKKVALVRLAGVEVWNWREEDGSIIFTTAPDSGQSVTLVGYNRPTRMVADSDPAWWDEEYDDIPLCYAQALALGDQHSARLDDDSYAANFMDRAASPNQILSSSDYWMAQYRSQRRAKTMPRISTTLRRA